MRTYRGTLHRDGRAEVIVTHTADNLSVQYELTPENSFRIRQHSPTGFNWGYFGSGPAQLALAILLDATDSIRIAKQVYQKFKRDKVATWREIWEITSEEILAWIASTGALLQPEEEVDHVA